VVVCYVPPLCNGVSHRPVATQTASEPEYSVRERGISILLLFFYRAPLRERERERETETEREGRSCADGDELSSHRSWREPTSHGAEEREDSLGLESARRATSLT